MQQWKKRGTYHSVLEAIQEMSGLTEEELLSPSHIEPNRIQNIPEAAECIRACAEGLVRNIKFVIQYIIILS